MRKAKIEIITDIRKYTPLKNREAGPECPLPENNVNLSILKPPIEKI